MDRPVVFMFSGQGSQYYRMGMELYEKHSRFRFWMDRCGTITDTLIDQPLARILYRQEGKEKPFDRLLYSNPALLSVEYSLAQMLMESGLRPDYLWGYSLGELTALVVSGALSLEEGLRMAVDGARLLEARSPPASMLSIIGNPQIFWDEMEMFRRCWLTARNFSGNFVVCGLLEDILCLEAELRAKDVLFQKLSVKYGFHTPLIDPLRDDFREMLDCLSWSEAGIPIISSLGPGWPHKADASYFWEVMRRPIQFQASAERLLKHTDYLFIDVGPSGTLATFIKYLLPPGSGSRHLEVMNPYGRDLQVLAKAHSALALQGINLQAAC